MAGLNLMLDPEKPGKAAKSLGTALAARIVGQDEAVRQIVNVYQTWLAGLNPVGRPVGSFLFLGPTGTGKTRTVEALAEALLGNPRAVIKVDCGEFQHSHEIAKLIGSPPGYLGHRETHPALSQEMLNQWHTDAVKLSFVLFDEIEKASDALWNLLLGILDKATLTLGDNRRVDFSRAMIFMTSNLGASEMSDMLAPRMGFFAPEPGERNSADLHARIEQTAIEAARRKFTPEFINRLDKMVVYHPLSAEQMHRILDIELRLLQERIFHTRPNAPFVFTVSEAAREYLMREGTDPRYGARSLKRAIEKVLVQPISNLAASSQLRGGDWVKVDYEPDSQRILFLKQAEGMTATAMAEIAVKGSAFAAAA